MQQEQKKPEEQKKEEAKKLLPVRSRSTSTSAPCGGSDGEAVMKCDELIRWQDKDLTEYYEADSVDASHRRTLKTGGKNDAVSMVIAS